MEFLKLGAFFKSGGIDKCAMLEDGRACGETEDLRKVFEEINELYAEGVRKLDALDDAQEANVMLLSRWNADLLEQNSSLVDSLQELETAAVGHLLQLENTCSFPNSFEHVAKPQYPDGHTLPALAKRLQVDVNSLLELIHRAISRGCWDVEGLTFLEVSYRDIFGTASPPRSAPWLDETRKPVTDDTHLRISKLEAEFWKKYAEESEAKVVQARNQQLAAEMQVDLVSMEQQLVAVTSHNSVLRQELELTRQQVVDKEQLVQESQQNLKEVHAALSAEVADKQDHVVQLLQRVQQLEEECRQAKQQVNLHNDVIKSITKKAESYKSRLAVMESLPCEVASNSCVQYQLRNKKSVQNATYARDSSPGPSSQREPPTKDVKQVDLSVCLEQNVLGNFTNTTCNTSCISRG